MTFATRSLSPQESRIVLGMAEHGSKEIERGETIDMLGVSPQTADNMTRSLRRKGWLEPPVGAAISSFLPKWALTLSEKATPCARQPDS